MSVSYDIDTFLSSLPEGDVLVVGHAEDTAVAIAERGIPTVLAGDKPPAVVTHGSSPLIYRRLPLGLLSYPPNMFAGCWLACSRDEMRSRAVRLLIPGGVLARPLADAITVDGSAAVPDHDCVLCPPLRFRFNRIAELPGAGGLLWGDDDIFVIPDLAPITVGHLLVVTTRHWMSAGACPPSLWPKIRQTLRRVAALYRRAYGSDTLIFEHGPARSQEAGSCIDHAHWHCIPSAIRVRPVIERHGLRGTRGSFSDLHALREAGTSYVYVEEGGQGWAYPTDDVPSQFLRWAAASALPASRGSHRWQEVFATERSRLDFMSGLGRLVPLVDAEPPLVASLPTATSRFR